MKIKTGAVMALCALILISAGAALAAENVIRIGVAGSHSGDLASYGLPAVKAVSFVVEQVNAKGGVGGKKLEVITQDDGCKPELAESAATRLITDKAAAVIGHICSGATKAVLGKYKSADIICISPSATASELTLSGDYPNFFRTIAHDQLQAGLQADFVINRLKAKKVAILHDKGDYGKGNAQLVKAAIEKSGKASVALFEGVTSGSVNYAPIVQKVKHVGADAVVWGGYHSDASKIIMQMRRKKMNIWFVGADGLKDDTFIKVAGKDAEGVYVSGPMDYSQNPIAMQARELYKSRFGEEPGAFYLEAYAAALALVNAMEKAGCTRYDALVKALRTEYVETPLGRIRFDKNGDAEGIRFTMYKVTGGRFVEEK